MAIAHRATGAVKANTGSGNVATIALPTGHTTNDILILYAVTGDNVAATVSGWTSKLALNNGTAYRLMMFWLRDNGSVTSPTLTHAAGDSAIAWISAYSGVDTGLADPFRDVQTQTGTGAATTFTVTMPALTGVVSGDMIIGLPTFSRTGFTDGTPTFTQITGFTERSDGNSGLGANHVAGASDDKLATGSAGSVTSTAAWNGTGSPIWIGAQLALSSAVSGSTVMPPLPFIVDSAVDRSASW